MSVKQSARLSNSLFSDVGIGFVVFSVSLALRAWHVVGVRTLPEFSQPKLDAATYMAWSDRLSHSFEFGEVCFSAPPLYAYFLGALKSITGLGEGPSGAEGLIWVQIVMGALTAVLVSKIAIRLLNPVAGLCAGLLYGVCEIPMFYDAILVPSTFGILLSLVATYRLIVWRDLPPSRIQFLFVGSLLGFSALARERFAVFALCALIVAVTQWRRQALWMIVPLVALLSLPSINNALAEGDFIPYSTNGGLNFYIGNGPEAVGTFKVPSGFQGDRDHMYSDAMALAVDEEGRKLSLAQVDQFWYAKTLAFMADHPRTYLLNLGVKLRRILERDESWDVAFGEGYRTVSGAMRIPLPGFAVMGTFGIAGLLLMLRRSDYAWLHVHMASQAFFFLLFFTGSRFRTGFYPALTLGTIALAHEIFQRRRTPKALALPIALIFMAGMCVMQPWRDRPSSDRSWSIWHSNRGYQAFQRGDHEAAMAEAEKAISLQSHHASPYVLMGRLLLMQSRAEEASQHFALAVEWAPRDLRALKGLIVSLNDLGRLEDSRVHADTVLSIQPGDPLARYSKGLYCLKTGAMSEALIYLEPLRDHPQYADRVRRLLSPR